MNMTPSEGKAFASELKSAVKESDTRIMVAPPFVTIPAVVEVLKGSNVQVGAQNMSDKRSGAHTGEVSVLMLKDLGVSIVILGHSERRAIYGESDAFINAKVLLALEEGMEVLLCIGETLTEREGGRLEEVLTTQITEGLKGVSAEQMKGSCLPTSRSGLSGQARRRPLRMPIMPMHSSAPWSQNSTARVLQKSSLYSMVVQ